MNGLAWYSSEMEGSGARDGSILLSTISKAKPKIVMDRLRTQRALDEPGDARAIERQP